jgi:ribosomal protein L34E
MTYPSLKFFSSKIKRKSKMPSLAASNKHLTGIPSHRNKTRKRNGRTDKKRKTYVIYITYPHIITYRGMPPRGHH